MRLPYAVATNSLPRLLGIGCAAACLLLAGCSTFEAGTPKAAVNYREPPAANAENHTGSLEQVITVEPALIGAPSGRGAEERWNE
jgi:hypothetical protein